MLCLACESDHDRATAAIATARAAIEAGHPGEAIPELERAVSIEASREALTLLARAEAETDDHAAAIAALDRADALGPATAGDLELRARSEIRLEHWDLAQAALGSAIAAGGDASELVPLRADALLHLDRRDEAMGAYRTAILADPTTARLRVALAMILLDVEVESGTSRACPGAEPGPDGVMTVPPLALEGVPAGDGAERCLDALGWPCAARVTARQLLERAGELAPEGDPAHDAVTSLLTRAGELDAARAEHCPSPDAIGALAGAWSTSPSGGLGDDPMSALGALMGDEIGENFGFGGLGLRGTGGSGGTGDPTIGLGSIGTIGHGAGPGTGGDVGFGSGSLGGASATIPRVRTGTADVDGALSPEVIRRVVRRHINEIRFCYEQALGRNPATAGRISIAFTIDGTGAVAEAHLDTDTVGDAATASCIVSAHRRWTFPAPEGGAVVHVTYPYVLETSE